MMLSAIAASYGFGMTRYWLLVACEKSSEGDPGGGGGGGGEGVDAFRMSPPRANGIIIAAP
jgi:hypothetical protein